MSRTWGANFPASSNEMVYGIVARTHSAPSSRWGMNSPPIKGTSNSEAPKTRVATSIVTAGWSRHQSSSAAYSRLNHSYGRLTFSLTPRVNQYEASTGTRVSVKINEPSSAYDIVSAIGRNSFPDGPLRA